MMAAFLNTATPVSCALEETKLSMCMPKAPAVRADGRLNA